MKNLFKIMVFAMIQVIWLNAEGQAQKQNVKANDYFFFDQDSCVIAFFDMDNNPIDYRDLDLSRNTLNGTELMYLSGNCTTLCPVLHKRGRKFYYDGVNLNELPADEQPADEQPADEQPAEPLATSYNRVQFINGSGNDAQYYNYWFAPQLDSYGDWNGEDAPTPDLVQPYNTGIYGVDVALVLPADAQTGYYAVSGFDMNQNFRIVKFYHNADNPEQSTYQIYLQIGR